MPESESSYCSCCCGIRSEFWGNVFVVAVLIASPLIILQNRLGYGEELSESRFWRWTLIIVIMMAWPFALICTTIYTIYSTVRKYPMRVSLWILATFMLIVPSAIIYKYPTYYNELTAFLLSFGLFVLSAWASHLQSTSNAEKQVNKRWLPQAEGACDRLLNLTFSVKRFQKLVSASCGELCDLVPRLKKEEAMAIKVGIEKQCSQSSEKLRDLANDLESAYCDWQRFIEQNCQEGECGRIEGNLTALRTRLQEELDAMIVQQCENVDSEMH